MIFMFLEKFAILNTFSTQFDTHLQCNGYWRPIFIYFCISECLVHEDCESNEYCTPPPENKCVDACTLDGKINNK